MVPFKVEAGLAPPAPPPPAGMARGPMLVPYGPGHQPHPPQQRRGHHGQRPAGTGSGGTDRQQQAQQQHLARTLCLQGAPGHHRPAYRTTRGYHPAGNGAYLGPPTHLQGGAGGAYHPPVVSKPSAPLQPQKKQLSAKELTGAPLISYVPRNRKVKKKISDSSVLERSRHCSQPNYYLGQNLYRNIQIQDFYHNPIYAMHSTPVYTTQHHHNLRESVSTSCDTLSDSYSISSDDLDNFLPRIIRPRRRRKKEKKEKKKRKEVREGADRDGNKGVKGVKGAKDEKDREETESCLGSEKQWLPQGLLSAESSYDSRSDSGSSVDESPASSSSNSASSASPLHRKLGPALSMPACHTFAQSAVHLPSHIGSISSVGAGYIGYNGDNFGLLGSGSSLAVGGLLGVSASTDSCLLLGNSHSNSNMTSDYSSLNSNSSDTPPSTPPSSSTDHLFDSDSSRSSESEQTKITRSKNGDTTDESSEGTGHKPPLKLVKSTSSSFFRSPKMASKLEARDERTKKILRKTNSWNPAPRQEEFRASFSLFSPAGSIDLLSGIRKNLRRLDLNSDDE